MADKLIISFEEYTKIVEKLAIEIHNNYSPTVLVGIMRGAAPILDILFKPIIFIQLNAKLNNIKSKISRYHVLGRVSLIQIFQNRTP